MTNQQLDSLKAAQNDTDEVDTFSVEKIDTSTPAGKVALAKEKKETDSIVNDASILIHSGDPNAPGNSENPNGIVMDPDVAPTFPGGEMAMESYIKKHQEYPLIAFQNEIKGTVQVKFVVETDGTVSGVTILEGIGYGCDESAADMIRRMPKWIPGKKAGVNVRCSVVLPLYYGQ